jgi:ribosomal protein S6
MLQMSFNAKPAVMDDLKHDMRTDERVLRWIAVKDRALKPLKAYPARDPRNPLNITAMNDNT